MAETFSAHLPAFAFAAALAWASGLRLYLVLFVLGLLGHYGVVDLPGHLEMLSRPLVLGASGFMVVVEFSADKIPFIDSIWDAVHTFVRIPGGALLAASMIGDTGEAALWATAILGGTLAAVAHGAKASSRAVVNTSPEPFSNWTASLAEEGLVLGGLWASIAHPLLFVSLLAVFVVFALWLMWRFWRLLRTLFARKRLPPTAGAHGDAH